MHLSQEEESTMLLIKAWPREATLFGFNSVGKSVTSKSMVSSIQFIRDLPSYFCIAYQAERCWAGLWKISQVKEIYKSCPLCKFFQLSLTPKQIGISKEEGICIWSGQLWSHCLVKLSVSCGISGGNSPINYWLGFTLMKSGLGKNLNLDMLGLMHILNEQMTGNDCPEI